MPTIVIPLSLDVGGNPTDADSLPTIGIYDNTTSTQVVANGTATTRTGTGTYEYTYASAAQGHTYTSTFVITVSGATYSAQNITAVQAATTIPASSDDGSSSYIATQWAAQRGLWTSIKNAALGALAAAIQPSSGNPLITYSISGREGSESVSFTEFENAMGVIAQAATEQEIKLTQSLQDVQPFDVRQRVGVRRRWGYMEPCVARWIAVMALIGVIAAMVALMP